MRALNLLHRDNARRSLETRPFWRDRGPRSGGFSGASRPHEVTHSRPEVASSTVWSVSARSRRAATRGEESLMAFNDVTIAVERAESARARRRPTRRMIVIGATTLVVAIVATGCGRPELWRPDLGTRCAAGPPVPRRHRPRPRRPRPHSPPDAPAGTAIPRRHRPGPRRPRPHSPPRRSSRHRYPATASSRTSSTAASLPARRSSRRPDPATISSRTSSTADSCRQRRWTTDTTCRKPSPSNGRDRRRPRG